MARDINGKVLFSRWLPYTIQKYIRNVDYFIGSVSKLQTLQTEHRPDQNS